jgi:hypothetical protein
LAPRSESDGGGFLDPVEQPAAEAGGHRVRAIVKATATAGTWTAGPGISSVIGASASRTKVNSLPWREDGAELDRQALAEPEHARAR